jgi:hypothetical protein
MVPITSEVSSALIQSQFHELHPCIEIPYCFSTPSP